MTAHGKSCVSTGLKAKCSSIPVPSVPLRPNAGLVRYQPGTGYPRHRHDYGTGYVLDGEFVIGGKTYEEMGDHELPSGPATRRRNANRNWCTWLMGEYPGLTTSKAPMDAGRFNMETRKALD